MVIVLDHGGIHTMGMVCVAFPLKWSAFRGYKIFVVEHYYPQINKIKDPKLRQLVVAFVKEHEHYSVGSEARHECGYASEKFLKLAVPILGERDGVGVLATGRRNPYRRYCRTARGHFVIKIGRLRIDFTARQFHPRFSFPRVWVATRNEDARTYPANKTEVYLGEGVYKELTYFNGGR